ncbi:MAG: hypothetical protein ACK4K1_02525 [Flavobacterium sp.]
MKHSIQVVMGFLAAIFAGTSAPTVNGQVLKTKVHYFSGFLNDLQDGRVTKDGLKSEVGVRSISDNMIPNGIDFLVTGVRVLFDTTAGVQAAGIKTAGFASTAPAAFKNGEVTLKQGADLLNLTGTTASNHKASTGVIDDTFDIVPVKLRGGVKFDLVFSLAGTAAADQAYKVELIGYELASADRA